MHIFVKNYIQNECLLKVNNKITNSNFFKGKYTHDGVDRFEFNIKSKIARTLNKIYDRTVSRHWRKVAQNENKMKLHCPGFCLKGMSGLQVREAELKS